MLPVPDGFELLARTSPFIDLAGPIYQKRTSSALVIGLRAEEQHCNMRGQVHGGVICTLADIALGYSSAFSTQPPTPLVTVSMNVDFVGGADRGDWIEVHTEVQKTGRRLAFANCHLQVGSKRIARASAVFSVVEAKLEAREQAAPAH
jgi:uncharacterized protein (TIGR00369 family)